MIDTTTMSDAVNAYIEHGATPFPLRENAKCPPPRGVTGHNEDLTAEEIRALWEDVSGSENVGVRVPDNVIVIDVDHYGEKTGADTLKALEDELGELPPTWSSTRRGEESVSRKYFYSVPTGKRWKSPGTDIDVIQHTHRYAVVFPSVVDGLKEEWYDPDGQPCEIPSFAALPALPESWVDRLETGHRTTTAKAPARGYKEALTWLESRVFAGNSRNPHTFEWEEGSRYDSMNSDVLTFVNNAVHRGHSGLLDGLTALCDAYVAEVGAGRAGEFERSVVGAVSLVEGEISSGEEPDINWRERFGAEPLGEDHAVVWPVLEIEVEEDDDGLSWGPSDTDAILSGEAVRREPELLELTDGSHLLYRGKVHNVYAPSETGKSWFMFAAAASVLQEGGHVLHVDAEMDVFDCIENLRLLGVPDEYLTTEHYWHIADMDNPAIDAHSFERWEWLLEAKPWDLVLMDSVGQLMGGMDNNSAAEYREWHRHMPNKARLKGLTVVMIDHISKTQELAGNIGHPEGTTNKKNQADVTIYLRKVGDGLEIGKVGELEILITKDRFGSLRKTGVNGYKGFKCRGRFRLDSTDRDRSEWSFVSSQDAYMEGFKAIPPMAPAGVLDAFDASIGEVNTALVTFLDTEGTGVTRSELTQAWESYAPALLEKHRRNKVLKSESGLTNENRRLKVKPSPRLAGEVSQGTINAMISALAETV